MIFVAANHSPILRRIVAATLLSITAAVSAQPAVPDAGSLLRQQLETTPTLPQRTAPNINNEIIAPTARDAGAVRFELTAIHLSGNSVFSEAELLALLQDLIGRSVGLGDLDAATARISQFYRSHGYPVARAYLPAQDVIDGAVQIAVIEGHIGDVRLYDGSRVRTSEVRRHLQALPGALIASDKLERTLLLLDDLSGVGSVHATLSPGARSGESDIAVELDREPYIAGSLAVDNYGNRYVGTNQLTAQIEMNSPLRIGDELTAQFTRSDDDMEYQRVSYQFPLGTDGFELDTTYIATDYGIGKEFAALDASGDSDSYTLGASYPLIRSSDFSLYARAAQSWREFEDRTFGSQLIDNKSSNATTLMLHGNGYDNIGNGGGTAFALGYTNGKLDIETPVARSIDDLTAHTHGRFDKWNLQLLRVQNLGSRTSTYLAFTAQKANGNLDSSEKFILGGVNGIRAYPQGEAAGDSGYVASAELRYQLKIAPTLGAFQASAFVETGAITLNENPFADDKNHRRLSGCGVGLTWFNTDALSIKLSLARRLGNEPALSDKDDSTRLWAQVTWHF